VGGTGVGEDSVQRPRNALEIEGVDEDAGVEDLAASAAAHEPPKLLLAGPATPLGHPLECPKPMEITVGAEDFFDGRRTDRTDQLNLPSPPPGRRAHCSRHSCRLVRDLCVVADPRLRSAKFSGGTCQCANYMLLVAPAVSIGDY
jgi:hypothetical protein